MDQKNWYQNISWMEIILKCTCKDACIWDGNCSFADCSSKLIVAFLLLLLLLTSSGGGGRYSGHYRTVQRALMKIECMLGSTSVWNQSNLNTFSAEKIKNVVRFEFSVSLMYAFNRLCIAQRTIPLDGHHPVVVRSRTNEWTNDRSVLSSDTENREQGRSRPALFVVRNRNSIIHQSSWWIEFPHHQHGMFTHTYMQACTGWSNERMGQHNSKRKA